MVVNIYTCWVTLLLPTYQDKLIAELVKKGYTIGPASSDLSLSNSSTTHPAYLVAFTAHKNGVEVMAKQIYDDMVAILTESKSFYYSIIVAQSYDASWAGSNFSFPEKKPPELPKPPTPNKGNLN